MPELFLIRICICVITRDTALPLHFDYFIDLVCLEMLSSTSSEFWKIRSVESRECRSRVLWLPMAWGYLWADNRFCSWRTGAPEALYFPFLTIVLRGWRWTLPPPQLTSQKQIDCWRLLINGLCDRKMPYFWIVFFPKVMYKEFFTKIRNFLSRFDLLSCWRMSQQLHI